MSTESSQPDTQWNFHGHVIWIAGGAGYLGTQVVQALVRGGARVVVWDLPGKDADWDLAKSDLVCFRPGNLGEAEEPEAWFEGLGEEWATPTGAVLMTYRSIGKPFSELNFSDLTEAFAVGCGGPFLWCRAAADRMKDSGKGGSIVVFSSMYGAVAPDPDAYPGDMSPNPVEYGMQKSALDQMIRYFSVRYGPASVRTNGVAPGPFPAPLVQEQFPEFIERLAARVPLKRIGQSPEMIAPVLFLLSSGASFVNGHVLRVDGGWTAW